MCGPSPPSPGSETLRCWVSPRDPHLRLQLSHLLHSCRCLPHIPRCLPRRHQAPQERTVGRIKSREHRAHAISRCCRGSSPGSHSDLLEIGVRRTPNSPVRCPGCHLHPTPLPLSTTTLQEQQRGRRATRGSWVHIFLTRQ